MSDSKISLLITEQLWNHVASGTVDLETLQVNLEKIVERAHAAGVKAGIKIAIEIATNEIPMMRDPKALEGQLLMRKGIVENLRQKAEGK